MQVRMSTFVITEQDRRAIRFMNDKRKTMCTRDEAKAWIDGVVATALRDLRYRWDGPQTGEAEANGASPQGLASVATPSKPTATLDEVQAGVTEDEKESATV